MMMLSTSLIVSERRLRNNRFDNQLSKNIMSVFKDKTLLITGGTGSFGNAVLNRFLRTDIGEIRPFEKESSTMCIISKIGPWVLISRFCF